MYADWERNGSESTNVVILDHRIQDGYRAMLFSDIKETKSATMNIFRFFSFSF